MSACFDPVMEQLLKLSREVGEVKHIAQTNKHCIEEVKKDLKRVEEKVSVAKWVEKGVGIAAGIVVSVLGANAPGLAEHLKGWLE